VKIPDQVEVDDDDGPSQGKKEESSGVIYACPCGLPIFPSPGILGQTPRQTSPAGDENVGSAPDLVSPTCLVPSPHGERTWAGSGFAPGQPRRSGVRRAALAVASAHAEPFQGSARLGR
jgi:hypothetical protein